MLDDVIDRLKMLVSFATVGTDGNGDIVDWITEEMRNIAADMRIVVDGDPPLRSIWMRFGPAAPGGILLSGHLDVVPPTDGWSGDPWRLDARGERLHGRGACDMKGFVACLLAAAHAWKARDLSVPIHVALSCDEETGSRRLPSLIADMKRHNVEPEAVVVGEPTEMRIIRGHKGTFGARTRILGRGAHSSDPRHGVNANFAAARLLVFLEELQCEFATAPQAGSDFDPPFTTINPGIVHGGRARNIVADCCEVQWDCRLMPGQRPADIRARIDNFCSATLLQHGRAISSMTEQLTFMPPLEPRAPCPATELLAGLRQSAVNASTNANDCVSYATEAGFFQQAGWPTVVCGPGSIDQAHRPDEYVETTQLRQCLDMLCALPSALERHRERQHAGRFAS
ncbi:acetylornithine deacetylase [Hoeflea poritis]|uniref:Acetylornithine deacetylase n=1 Tax=Hoeflea poritis TaxID=2993659 RepID=A0ABT4VT24_9HYPH|nr:acetylornithine deacetylase [Hoeflea poritis]MDA4847855.1 acetylornithine deacetylase [Hoeflea poritis]